MFKTRKALFAAAVYLLNNADSVEAFWRLPCAKPITVQRIDPIVNNGTVSGHIHTIMGGSAITSRVNYEQATNSKCATCTVLEDNSNYWIPSLFYQHADGTLESVPQNGGALVYYLQRKSTDTQQLHAFPHGFQMLAGNPGKRAYDGSLEARAMSYACLDYAHPSAETPAFPQKNCPQGLRTQVFFPSCWDGVNLDSANHKDHVVYPSGMDNGDCPSTHPVRLVSIFYEVTWDVNKFKDGWLDANGKPYRAQPYIWSMGDNTGFGLHGDFLNGWNVDVLQKAVDECTDLSGIVEYCKHFHFRSNDAANACLPEFLPETNDQVFGQMKQLPNITPIPVASYFDPCGDSPFAGFDNTVAGQPLGTCTTGYSGRPAYAYVNGLQGKDTPVTPVQPTPFPNPIDQNLYLGCYVDNNPSRTLEKRLDGGDQFTPATCRAAVQKLGGAYKVFGIQFGGECWASTSTTAYKSQGASDKCIMPCRADAKGWTFCGGPGANQVYQVGDATSQPTPDPSDSDSTPIPDPTPSGIDTLGYVGCYVDNIPSRTMEKQLDGNTYTPATCRAAVQNLGGNYAVFGIQYGGECWATTSTTSYKSEGVSNNCNMACRSDATGKTICGGPNANQVYQVTVSAPVPAGIDPVGYVGCYVDGIPSRTMEKQLNGNTYTPDTCRAAVKALGGNYSVFGIQYGGECWASTSKTSYTTEGVSSSCNMACRSDATGKAICGGPNANQVYNV